MPGGQKSPGRRPKENNARRAKKPGPQAQREQRPEGEKARAAGPERTMPGGRRKPGRRPKKKQHSEGKKARAAWPRRKQRPEGEKKHFQKGPGPQAHKNIIIFECFQQCFEFP